ncbi:MAG: SDR family NAD(P)-dependent oxidoreductase [Mycobacteriales bacterium]
MSRKVLVVGASSGIGRAVAHELAGEGAELILASRGKQALDDAAEECRLKGAADVRVAPVDVRDRAAVEDLVRSEAPFDAVIYAAALLSYGRFEELPAEVFDAVLETNLTGAANVARAVLPLMRKEKHGSIVLVSSALGDSAAPSMTPYVVSKWGIRALGRQLALENRDLPDVNVTVVSPGGVDTPIYRRAANYQGRAGRPPAPVDGPAKVAKVIVRALDNPRDRISVGKLNGVLRFGFSWTPALFDSVIGPVLSVLGTRPEPVEPTTGSVLHPMDDLEAVEGGYGQGLKDIAGRLRGR